MQEYNYLDTDKEVINIFKKNDAAELNKLFIHRNAYLRLTNGFTLLHIAALYCNKEIVQLMLKSGINPTAQNIEGITSIDLAAKNPNSGVLELLKSNVVVEEEPVEVEEEYIPQSEPTNYDTLGEQVLNTKIVSKQTKSTSRPRYNEVVPDTPKEKEFVFGESSKDYSRFSTNLDDFTNSINNASDINPFNIDKKSLDLSNLYDEDDDDLEVQVEEVMILGEDTSEFKDKFENVVDVSTTDLLNTGDYAKSHTDYYYFYQNIDHSVGEFINLFRTNVSYESQKEALLCFYDESGSKNRRKSGILITKDYVFLKLSWYNTVIPIKEIRELPEVRDKGKKANVYIMHKGKRIIFSIQKNDDFEHFIEIFSHLIEDNRK